MPTWLIFMIWVAMGITAAYLAQKRDRNPIGWFFIGVSLGVLGILILLLLPPKKATNPMSPEPALLESSPFPLSDVPEDLPMPEVPSKKRLSQNPRIHWYFVDKNKMSKGPLLFDEIKAAYNTGALTPDSLLWNEELEQWTLLKNFSDYHFILHD